MNLPTLPDERSVFLNNIVKSQIQKPVGLADVIL
jgi:hypothetical protein